MHKILIGVPVIEYRDKFVRTFMNFWTELNVTPKPYSCSYTFVYRQQLDVAQNRIANEAIKGEFTHVMFIEDDVYGYTKIHLDKLLMDNLDIVAGLYWSSEFPYDLCALRKFDKSIKYTDFHKKDGKQTYELPNLKGIQEVDLTHIGFTLIKTDVFKAVEYPYFQHTHEYNSDGYFYQKAMEKGYKLNVDCDVVLNHRGITPKNVNLYKQIGLVDEKYKDIESPKVIIYKNEEEAKVAEEAMNKRIMESELINYKEIA